MKKYLLICLPLFASTIFAADDNIENLLENLREKSELHNQTKSDDSGIITIYTREDLTRMQAYTLKDVLKSIPFANYQEGLVSTPNLAYASETVNYMPKTRLYIDDHEVSSTYFGSAFYIYGDMNLGYVDHIEIYHGGNTIEFGAEPSLSTIKVYTKTPDRENSTQLQMTTDNRASFSGYLYDAHKDGELEYSAYASAKKLNRETYNHNGNELSKSAHKSHLLMTLKYKDFKLMMSRYDSEQDGFAGYGTNRNPTDINEIYKYHQFMYASYKITDNLEAYASIDDMSTSMYFHEDNGYNRVAGVYINSDFEVKWKENIYKTGIRGSKIIGSNELRYGLEYANKSLSPKVSMYDKSIDTLDVQGPTSSNIYSLYIQDSYKVYDNSKFIAAFKVDNNSDNDQIKSATESIFRFGYMYQNEKYSAKLFHNHTYIYPSYFYTTTYSGKSHVNPELEPVHYNGITAEVAKHEQNYELKLGVIYLRVDDSISIQSGQYTNSDEVFRVTMPYVELNYNFDLFNKMHLNIYSSENSDSSELSSSHGAIFRIMNKYNKFNFFNELIYRSAFVSSDKDADGNYIKIKKGYDYSLGVTYEVNSRLSFNLKGENLLNSAIKTPISKVGAADSFDRTFLMGMEYIF